MGSSALASTTAIVDITTALGIAASSPSIAPAWQPLPPHRAGMVGSSGVSTATRPTVLPQRAAVPSQHAGTVGIVSSGASKAARPVVSISHAGPVLSNLILSPQRTSCKHQATLPNPDPREPKVHVCLDKIHHPCKAFSIGIDYKWDFDDYALKDLKCEVWSFDPSMAEGKYQRGPLHHFDRTGIADMDGVNEGASTLYARNGVTATNYKVHTLRTLMNDRGVQYLDIIRMDVEGAEWGVLEQWTKDNMWPYIGQLLLEVHMYPFGKSAGGLHRWANVLNAIPMKIFHSAQNNYDNRRVYVGLTAVYELGFTKLRRLSSYRFSDFNGGRQLSDLLEAVFYNGTFV